MNTTIIITPRVQKAAQKYYNCPSLEGMELENEGYFLYIQLYEIILFILEMKDPEVFRYLSKLNPERKPIIQDPIGRKGFY